MISGAPGHVTRFLQPKNWQKMDEFKPVYLGNTANINDKRFVIFENTINRISLGYVCLLQLEY